MERKLFKKLIVTALCAATITCAGIAGAGLVNAFSSQPITASAAEEVTERKDVKITKIDNENGTATCVHFDLDASRTGNGLNVNNKKAVGNYIYYNRETCFKAKFDVHMRSNMFWFYPKEGTTLAVGDTLTFVKGLRFPVVTTDGTAYKTYKDYLGETTVWEYTESGWVNKTEENKKTEQQVTITGLGGGVGNGETFKTNYNTNGNNDMNYTFVQKWIEAKGYLLLNGEPYNNGDIHCMSGNFYVYPSTAFNVGDTITVLEGLHMPANATNTWGQNPAYTEQTYSGYIAETFTIEYTSAGWVKKAEAGEPNTLKDVTALTENEAGATMPATYSFTMNFNLRVSKDELTELEKDDNYAANIYINGKSVKEWNATTTAEDNDGEIIPAISVSAYGAGITLSVVKSTNIIKAGEGFSAKVGKEFVCSTGNIIEEDITRYYLPELEYWTNVEPYEIQKTQALTIKNVGAFEIIDGGANGVVFFNFNENVASKQLLAYNFHPAYMKTLPAAYPVDLADEFAASGATVNFINHVVINGKTIAEYWKDLSGAQAKSSRFECHILATSTGVNRIRIGSNVSNGFDGNTAITVTLKEGLVFYGGAYLDHDVTLTYTPANGDVAASTVYASAAKTIELAADETNLVAGNTANLTATVAPADYTGELVYEVSDNTVVSVADGVITALKAGVATITAKVGDVISNEVTITVKNPAATAIAIAADKTELEVSQTAKITPTVTPAEYDGTLVYVVSDNTVVSVSADGVITALKAGTATITARIGDELVSNEITVTVTEKEEPVTPGESTSESNSASAGESADASESTGGDSANTGDSASAGNSASGNGSTGSSGCGGAVSAGLFGILGLGIGAAVVAFKKKKD